MYQLEELLLHEFATLVDQGVSAFPGADGSAVLQLPTGEAGAATTRYAGLLGKDHNAENFLLASSLPDDLCGQRLVAAVSEGNHKAPVTVLAGTLALSELYLRCCGARRRDNLEDDVRVALAQAVQRLSELERAEAPYPPKRWRFSNMSSNRPSPLQGLGSSLTAVAITGRDAVLAHVGESQAYRVLAKERRLQRLSADHTLAADPEFQEHCQRDPELLALHGDVVRFVLGYCALADLQIEQLHLDPGDTLLLCSSSLRRQLPSDEQLLAVLAEPSPQAACAELLHLTSDNSYTAPSTTVVVLRP